jgi:hypothetical protein
MEITDLLPYSQMLVKELAEGLNWVSAPWSRWKSGS